MELAQLANGSWVCPTDPGEPTTGSRRVSITEREGRLLAAFAKDRTVVEIGTGLGVSTGWLATTARRVYTNDCDRWVWENIVPTLPENVQGGYHRGTYEDPIDLVFIDADHTAEATAADINYARTIIEPNGLIVVHDINIPSVASVLETNKGFRIDTQHGLGIVLP